MENEILRFVQFKSFVNTNFWYKLGEIKLEIDKLSDKKRKIYGTYTNCEVKLSIFEIDLEAFNRNFKPSRNSFTFNGILINKNTVEDFKNSNKTELIRNESNEYFFNNILNGNCLEDPSLIAFFILLSYADLKKHNFFYWFAFPAPIDLIVHKANETRKITEIFSSEQIDEFTRDYEVIENRSLVSFFITTNNLKIKFLKDLISHENQEANLKDVDLNTIYFSYSDPSYCDAPGWSLRNFIFVLIKLCPVLLGKTVKFLAVNLDENRSTKMSLIHEVNIPNFNMDVFDKDTIKWIGWEKNDQGNLGPRLVNMASSMDPIKLSEHFSNLNLKLMKWRLLPDLNLNVLKTQKCLLLGAGTLGCAIARNLMAWGVNHITFVDYGNVSYSNPVRQCLFTHEDAAKNRRKAQTAAERLKEILPTINATGFTLQIPMPGHTVGESMMEKTLEHIETLKKLVESHDVIFLLTDSRESRWFPTLLGAHYDKFVITTALGFDSYLVLRHGTRGHSEDVEGSTMTLNGLKCIQGNKLGCYFCNDVTAPGNSMKDRTLDQQCTVTRPGVSNIASSLAVELMVSVLQHEKKNLAPAYYKLTNREADGDSSIPEGVLGILPHSIRGYLSNFEQILPATECFSQCIACSPKILEEYRKHGNEFLLKVFESAKFLEDISGISEMENIESNVIDMEEIDSDFDLDASDD